MKKLFSLFFIVFAFNTAAHCNIQIDFQKPSGLNYFVGTPQMNVYADEFTTLVLNISSNKETYGRIIWVSSYDQQVSPNKSLRFKIKRSADKKEYLFDIASQNRLWSGFIRQLAFVPDSDINGMSVDGYAETRSISGLIRSGWQEFWAPENRLILGSTVNNMKAVNVWGVSFNNYLFSIVLLFFISIFSFYFYKTRDLKSSFDKCKYPTIVLSLLLWAFVQLSNTINGTDWLKDDIGKYGIFTSLEYKQEAALGENLYKYMLFCREALPKDAEAKTVSSDQTNFINTKLMYYLYPVNLTATVKTPKYLLVYQYNKSMVETLKENPGFRLLKKFDEGAYILWKK